MAPWTPPLPDHHKDHPRLRLGLQGPWPCWASSKACIGGRGNKQAGCTDGHLTDSSIHTPAHVPLGAWEHPAPPQSILCAPHPPCSSGDPQPLAVLTGLGAPRDGPSGDFLPGRLGGRVNKASRWLPAAARPWEHPSRRGHGRASAGGGGGGQGAVSPISRAPTTGLRLPGHTAPLRFPTSLRKGFPLPFTEGETEAPVVTFCQRPEAGPPLCPSIRLSPPSGGRSSQPHFRDRENRGQRGARELVAVL